MSRLTIEGKLYGEYPFVVSGGFSSRETDP